MDNYTNLENFNFENAVKEFNNKKELTITLPFANNETEGFMSELLKKILGAVNMAKIADSLEYCLKEIVMNASKANSKRIYFQSLNTDINDQKTYAGIMNNFRDEVFGNFSEYSRKHTDSGYFVKITFKTGDNNLAVTTINNSSMIPEEEKRIDERLKNAAKFTSMEDAIMHGFDQTEGGGFGIIIAVLMLRKIGLDERVLSFRKTADETSVSINVPLNLISRDQGVIIAREVTNEIESMPQFPESILRLQKNLSDPNSDYNSVAEIIKTDTSLATELIRIANSPIYMLPKKVEDVLSAVRMIGMNGIKNLVLSFGVNRVFEKKYDQQKIREIMDHSHKVAAYAGNFAKAKNFKPLFEDSYVGALLHDLGKIIVGTLQPELLKKIEIVCMKKGIPVSKLEDLTDGYNHSIIGGVLAEKWNFPEKFVQCIKYHHVPLEADDDHQALVMVVYLANQLYYYYRGQVIHENINFRVLKFFGLENEENFKTLAEKIKSLSEEQ